MTSSPTAELCKIVSAVTFESLDRETVAAVKRLIADAVAVAIAGSREAPPHVVAEHIRELGSAPASSVWGFGLRTAPAQAAYANAVSMHVLDFEPMSSPPTHAASPVVPAAFALAEARDASGADIIAACAKGFEIQGRVLVASGHDRGELPFHSPGVVGVMGSAVASGHVLRLGAEQLRHALGMAASRCSGLPANTGSMVKCTHCGYAAAGGVESAQMAARGFLANPGIFEAHAGYVATFFPKRFDYDALLRFGQPFRCVDPGMAIKFFPSKYPTHFAIAAALELRPRIGDPSSIGHVKILTPDIDDADRPQPRGGLEGKFSFQYTAAAALLDGKVGVHSFTDERRYRPDMVALLEKTTVVRDKTLSRDTRNMRVEVEVESGGGSRHKAVCDRPPGSWGVPIDAKQHRVKLMECLVTRLTEADATGVLERLDSLERLPASEVKRLIGVLAAA
jgi:aconitate decarboxylase